LQRAIDENTYKLVARNGHTSQDVLISVPDGKLFNEELLQESIQAALADRAEFTEGHTQTVSESDTICLSQYNRGLVKARVNFWREQHQEKHKQMKEQAKNTK
jgi:hypothetical protein